MRARLVWVPGYHSFPKWAIKDFFERETVALIVTEYDRDPGSNYADEQLK